MVRSDQVLGPLFQPGHPGRVGRAVKFGRVARVTGQDEIPDLVEIAVCPSSRHEHERQHMVDCYPFRADIREDVVAVGAAPVLITAEGIANARDRATAQEAAAAPDEQLASELADVLEVLRALAKAHDRTWEDIEVQARRKHAERGGFDRQIFLEHVDQAP
jgi:predicted house-cleaning noncanonical NTP pyrophosphatase (MazG superfamily)